MRKILNSPESFVDEVVEGIVLAWRDKVRILDGDTRILLRNPPARKGKVALVTGGGSGHLPVFLGYVGEGLLDGCAVGNVFASPSSQKMFAMIKACDTGAGVLCLYGNYGGDNLNFDMACEMADFEDIRTATVRVADDVASAPAGQESRRRGVAGMVYAFKIAGAAAEAGLDLDSVAQAARKALASCRTMGVALSPCILPQVGVPTFSIGENEIEIGMGIHGEPGIEVKPMMSADAVAGLLMDRIEADMPIPDGSRVSVMVNGLGATPLEELYIVYRAIAKRFLARGITVIMPHIGEFATSMEMAGLSVTVLKLDEELAGWLRAPADSPFYSSHNK